MARRKEEEGKQAASTLTAAAVIGAKRPRRLDHRASLPDSTRWEFGQIRTHVANLRVSRVRELAVPARLVWPTTEEPVHAAQTSTIAVVSVAVEVYSCGEA